MRVHISELVNALRAHGHDVHVVGPGGKDDIAAREGGGIERSVDGLRRALPPFVMELAELAYNVLAYARLSREAKAFKPDVLYERYNLFLLAGLVLKSRRRIPMILEINSPLASERAAFGRLGLPAVARWCEAALWRGADTVLPVTQVLADQVVTVRGGEAGVRVIHNGANLAAAPSADAVEAARRRIGIPRGALVLGFVGFVRAWHGVGWALEALTDLPPNTHLLVVGDGPALDDLRARADVLGLAPRVHFTGRVPHEEVAALSELIDVALQTAAVAYASPLKLFEYMARGRAVVAPDQPNIREILTDGDNALLFEKDDEASFRCALHRLVGDEALRRRLGAHARNTIERTPFTWGHNAETVAGLAQQLSGA